MAHSARPWRLGASLLHCACAPAVTLLALTAGCSDGTNTPNAKDAHGPRPIAAMSVNDTRAEADGAAGKSDVPEVPQDVRDEVLRLVREYPKWQRVSDMANWAPTDCIARPPAGIQASQSGDTGTHGGKLYYLYARYATDYTYLGWRWSETTDDARRHLRDGQMIVKESYNAVECGKLSEWIRTDNTWVRPPRKVTEPEHGWLEWYADNVGKLDLDAGHAIKDDMMYRMAERRDLFVMFKATANRANLSDTDAKREFAESPAPPEWSDDGWVYATLPADGSRIDQIGRISSCMGCHVDAQYDRCFGLARMRATERNEKHGNQ